ncbi:nuclear transcription factor Y subunit beta [Drosophila miranda]|uniref:nuclear transcription factor Y subunit beta n=1 Tax=Drosophila miranda TaxID=7229 RepID=UPI0007E833AE|nr:nuclear transcription factor Y subunit beta [Drosophila miranda]
MRSLCLTIALCLACLAAADVSHLPSSYLPPPKPEHAVSMSIEQQELRELPEQVEYMRENEQGEMEAMPSSLLTPPAPLETEKMDAMLSSRYLLPAQPQVQMEQLSEPLMMQQPQMEMMAPEQQPEQPQVASRYLPPAPASEQPQQLTYQQYQEQMQMQEQQQQQQQQEQQPQMLDEQMPYYMDVQQPMAPTDAEAEPEPAHELRPDGYHYKQAEEELRLRH